MLQVVGFALLFGLIMLASLPFLIYFGKPKPWQRAIQFLMSFPLDNEKFGFFLSTGGAVIVLLNGLLWGFAVIGIATLATMAVHIKID